MFRRVILALASALLLAGPARAATPPFPGLGVAPNSAAPGCVTVAGSGTPYCRDLASRALDFVNVREWTKGDGQRATTGLTLAAGGTTLTVGSGLFAAGDVGKTIVVPGAGATPSVGVPYSLPVTNGGNYTALPSCAITDPGGAGVNASCQVRLGVLSATVMGAGSGCTATAGSYTFALKDQVTASGATGTMPTFSIPVSGGAVAVGATATIQTAGSFRLLPNGTAFGGSCTTPPVLMFTFTVVEAPVSFASASGYDANTAGAISGGTFTAAATLGTPAIFYNVAPIVAKITAVASPTSVTLDTAGVTALTGGLAQIFWATDDTSGFQTAITTARALGKGGLYVPTGVYGLLSQTPLDPGTLPLTVRGDGLDASVMVWDAGTANDGSGAGTMWRNTTGGALASIAFRDMQFRGLLDTGRVNLGGAALYLNNFALIDEDHVKFYQISNMAQQNESAQVFRVANSLFDTVMRDQARCRSCFSGLIENDYFIHSDDDSVAWHQANYLTGTTKARKGLIVRNNYFEDTDAIAAIGAREVSVVGNICHRTKFGCVRIGPATSSEGNLPTYALDVTDNQAFDTLTRVPFGPASSAFSVMPNLLRTGTSDATALPGAPQASNYTIAQPYGQFDNATTDATQLVPPAYGFRVEKNRAERTLAPVANYSAWGRGKVLTSIGFLDPPVYDESLRPNYGIEVPVNGVGVRVLDNDVIGATSCIGVEGNVVVPADASGVVGLNHCYDTPVYGVSFTGSVSTTVSWDVEDNTFALDAFRLHSGRNATSYGTWTSGATSYAVNSATTLYGVRFERNRLYEMYAPYNGVSPVACTGNLAFGQFTTVGYNSLNAGMGSFAAAGDCIRPQQIFGSTGQSLTGFDSLNGAKVVENGAIPSSGNYMPGDSVRNTTPAAAGQIAEWRRITQGTGVVDGTDWGEVLFAKAGAMPTSSIRGSGTAPTLAAGTGAGTSPTVSLATASSDLDGILNVTTGTTPAAGAAVATLTFGTVKSTNAFCTLSPNNGNAAALNGANTVYPTGSTSALTLNAGSTALAASTAYAWSYHCLQ